MTIDNLIKLYEKQKKKHGINTYRHVSAILKEAKTQHKIDFLERIPNGDHEQSWRAFKGKNLEKLIEHIITDEVESLGLKIINGNKIERSKTLPIELEKVKRNLSINYGKFGLHLPDVDLIIYDINCEIIAVLSSKVTLRERIAQSAYWKLKLHANKITKHIKVYFITPDEDGTLTNINPPKKARAIVEADLDGSYVLSEKNIEESTKVKMFDKFIDDLRKLIN